MRKAVFMDYDNIDVIYRLYGLSTSRLLSWKRLLERFDNSM